MVVHSKLEEIIECSIDINKLMDNIEAVSREKQKKR